MTVKDIINSDNRDFLFFWSHREKAGMVTKACFSQWYACRFVVDGVQYNCAEQFMMAEKARLMGDEQTRREILQSTDPSDIKALGRKVTNFDEEKWNREKFNIVRTGNIHKFSQNEALKQFLLSTEGKILVEASPYDCVWGIGLGANEPETQDPQKWRGENLLGFALMEVRELLTPIGH